MYAGIPQSKLHPYKHQRRRCNGEGGWQKAMFQTFQHSEAETVFIEPLTAREHDVLLVLAEGASDQEIAQTLVISPNTVKRHVRTILAKLAVRNRTHAAARARRLGLLAANMT